MSDAVIIGGGPAGATAAILLARAGRAVTLIERSAGPTDKVCGDFLSAEAIAAVTGLGVDLAALSPAPIELVRLVHGRRMAVTRLPFPALGVTRRVLDEALLQQAAASGATVQRGHAVRSLADIGYETVFLATGKHDLRGAARGERGTGMVGLKMYYTLAPAQLAVLRHHVELILFAGGYAGLQLVEQDCAVLCLVAPNARLRRAGGSWEALLASLAQECPHLALRLADLVALLDRPLAVAGLPYGYVHAPSGDDPPGMFRLGDQATVIASLTGDGVALALASATLGVEMFVRHGNAATAYHRAWQRRVARQMRTAGWLHRACLTPAMQPSVLAACRLSPGIMRTAASWTRLEPEPLTSLRSDAPPQLHADKPGY